jgi:hypothetical protein
MCHLALLLELLPLADLELHHPKRAPANSWHVQ